MCVARLLERRENRRCGQGIRSKHHGAKDKQRRGGRKNRKERRQEAQISAEDKGQKGDPRREGAQSEGEAEGRRSAGEKQNKAEKHKAEAGR